MQAAHLKPEHTARREFSRTPYLCVDFASCRSFPRRSPPTPFCFRTKGNVIQAKKSHRRKREREGREGSHAGPARTGHKTAATYVRSALCLQLLSVTFSSSFSLSAQRGEGKTICLLAALFQPLPFLPQTSEGNQTARHENQNIRSNVRLHFLSNFRIVLSLDWASKREPDTHWLVRADSSPFFAHSRSPLSSLKGDFSPCIGFYYMGRKRMGIPQTR